MSIDVTNFELANDNGSSSTDGITSDAQLAGELSGSGTLSGIAVDFDHDNDGTSEGTVYSDAGGAFDYQPTGLSAGSVTIRARAWEWDPVLEDFVPGAWTSCSFTYTNAAPQIANLRLAADTGTPADLITYDGRVEGTVSDDGSAAEYTIQFDYNNDGNVDDSKGDVATSFVHYVGDGTGFGVVTVKARAAEWDEVVSSEVHGNWSR